MAAACRWTPFGNSLRTLTLSLRATQWRGNPVGHFGIPEYDPEWIAASALRAFLAMTRQISEKAGI